MSVYILTPTGLRPEGLSLLAEYIAAQTFLNGVVWVVVDDGTPASYIPSMPDAVRVAPVRPERCWRTGMNTQASSMLAGLELVPADATLFIMEDDDVYMPRYIETMLREIEGYELIGEQDARYYNVVSRRWRVLPGKFHASLASTVCRGYALEFLWEVCNTRTTMLDVHLWRHFPGASRLLDTSHVVGIKGLPGRPGIGVGHRARFGTPDTTGVLESWIGSYANNYEVFRDQSAA
jgi:hypothetical protein